MIKRIGHFMRLFLFGVVAFVVMNSNGMGLPEGGLIAPMPSESIEPSKDKLLKTIFSQTEKSQEKKPPLPPVSSTSSASSTPTQCLAIPVSLSPSVVFKKDVSFASDYEFSEENYLSYNEVNTVRMPAPIVRILQPVRQQKKESRARVCDTKHHCHRDFLLYDHDNREFSFSFSNPDFTHVQFTVFLENHETVSLHFTLADIPGGVVNVSSTIPNSVMMSGKDRPSLNSAKTESSTSYDQHLIRDVILALDKHNLNETGLHVNYHSIQPPMTPISPLSSISPISPISSSLIGEESTVYSNDQETVELWTVCNHGDDFLSLNARDFVNRFSKHNVLAAALSRTHLSPQQCTTLVMIWADTSNS